VGRRRMIEPWSHPRSKAWWFRRRVPVKYRKLGLPAEIKFSLDTKDWDEADESCREFNLHLERQWRATLANLEKPSDELSYIQITALAGEFYRDTVAANRENPGPRKHGTRSCARSTRLGTGVSCRRVRGFQSSMAARPGPF
jgi:hypothetical protein